MIKLQRSIPSLVAMTFAFLAFPSWDRLRAQGLGQQVIFQESFPAADLVLEDTLLGTGQTPVTRVTLRGTETDARPGFPRLPCVTRLVAVPLGAQVTGVIGDTAGQIPMEGHPLVEWQGGYQAGGIVGQRPTKPPEYPQGPDGPVYYAPDSRFVPMDPSLVQYEFWPPEAVVAEGRHDMGGYSVISLKIYPVRWLPRSGTLLFTPSIVAGLSFSGGQFPNIDQLPYNQREEIAQLRDSVANPALVIDPGTAVPIIPIDIDAWYLIITDNMEWNENKTTGFSTGDMISEFERLAEWKTEKGILAKVVTVSDILAGRYGNVSAGTRDLQEVIRNFLKRARSRFHTYWVLIGGDVNVIPPRRVAGMVPNGSHYLWAGTKAQPDKGNTYWDSGAKTVRIHDPGFLLPDVTICSRKTGKAFQRIASPTSVNPGWTYVTSDTYSSTTSARTEYIRLVGDPSDTEATDFYAMLDANTIPTDLYYASIDSALYGQPGLHDWDANNNGIYGQYDWTTSLDGVDYWPNLAVGRAPVAGVTEAKNFVDKVIAYEQYDGLPAEFGRKLLLGSSNWYGGPGVSPGTDPPAKGRFYSAPGGTMAKCHFDGAPVSSVSPFLELVAYGGPGSYQFLSYNSAASASSPGWYFCTSDSYSIVSKITYTFLGYTLLELPVPTEYVAVKGPIATVHPSQSFYFDARDADLSVQEKEKVKEQLETDFPELDLRERLYSDFYDTPGYPAADLFELTNDAMKAQLTTGYNLVSLTGHGWYGGCCGLDSGYVSLLRNGKAGGLVYADSCLTNQFDVNDAVSEILVKQGLGGMAAYVGNSRFSWIGSGSELERWFWHRMGLERRVGVLHNSKAFIADTDAHVWANYSLNLMRDPEMNLWVGTPDRLVASYNPCLNQPETLDVTVRASGSPVQGVRVVLSDPSGLFEVRYTDFSGHVSFFISGLPGGSRPSLVAVKSGYIPDVGSLRSGCTKRPFVRGDFNADHKLDISDAIAALGYLFNGGRGTECDDSADVNDDGVVDISDSIRLLGYLFTGDPPPPGGPAGAPQQDGTDDNLGCDFYPGLPGAGG